MTEITAKLSTALADRYRIESRLGEGGMAAGALLGTVTGLVVGTITSGERWEEVPLDQLQVSFVPQRDGRFALGLSVRF